MIRERLSAGGAVRGVFWAAADASLVEFVAMLGWDFIIVDLEHSAMNIADVEHCGRACQVRGIELLVRLPICAGSNMSRALDAGAEGIVVPYMESAADAKKAVELVKYPPLGRRGLAPMRGADFGMKGDLGEYTIKANRDTLIIVQIESLKGLKALPDIIEIEEVDVVFAGVLDLSMSLGLAGQTRHPEVQTILREISGRTRGANKVFGAYGSDAAMFQINRGMGARFLATALEDLIIEGSCRFLNEDINTDQMASK
jgi:4-hydroxy-2-oxoheptanedioate aldolase